MTLYNHSLGAHSWVPQPAEHAQHIAKHARGATAFDSSLLQLLLTAMRTHCTGGVQGVHHHAIRVRTVASLGMSSMWLKILEAR